MMNDDESDDGDEVANKHSMGSTNVSAIVTISTDQHYCLLSSQSVEAHALSQSLAFESRFESQACQASTHNAWSAVDLPGLYLGIILPQTPALGLQNSATRASDPTNRSVSRTNASASDPSSRHSSHSLCDTVEASR